ATYHQTLDAGNVTAAEDRQTLAEGVSTVLAGTVNQFRHTYEVVTHERAMWFEMFVVAMPAGKPGALVSLFDVTRERQSQSDLRVLADRDPLTGLPNRRAFEREAERALALASRRGSPAAVVFLDLDGFKDVNDTFGHAAGDDLLVHVARSLQDEVRSSDLLARWGGDEFVMLLPDLLPDEYRRAIERYRVVLGQPLRVDGQVLRARASFGAAFYPHEGLTLPELLSQADEGMYGDKAVRRSGRTRVAGRLGGWIGAGGVHEGRTPVLRSWLKPKGI
ncbi:MAG TPA: GGDEF domain-containing protein, partial [Trueperaceae bacterium]|nr:GGDEF domain-containing protein [Trueperaceae bacterium]